MPPFSAYIIAGLSNRLYQDIEIVKDTLPVPFLLSFLLFFIEGN